MLCGDLMFRICSWIVISSLKIVLTAQDEVLKPPLLWVTNVLLKLLKASIVVCTRHMECLQSSRCQSLTVEVTHRVLSAFCAINHRFSIQTLYTVTFQLLL